MGSQWFCLFLFVWFGFVGFDLNKRWTGLENITGQMIQPMMEQWYDFEACHLAAAKKRLFSFSKVPLVESKYSDFFLYLFRDVSHFLICNSC